MVTQIIKSVGITEFRRKLSNYFNKSLTGQPVVIANSNKQAVLIDIDTYNQLVANLEDAIDAKNLTKLVQENPQPNHITWDELKNNANE